MAEREQDATRERIVALEVRVAYQDHLLVTLNEVVIEFTRRVERLESTVRELRRAVTSEMEMATSDEPPPHY